MSLRPALTFAGNAESALTYYCAALGGNPEIIRFAGTPAEEDVPPQWSSKVLYGALHSPYGDVSVMDAPPGREGAPGDNFAIAIDIDDEQKAADVFARLSADGAVLMPFEKTFFAQKFGMTTDKFGVRWMVSVRPGMN
jgi:PhnB protein